MHTALFIIHPTPLSFPREGYDCEKTESVYLVLTISAEGKALNMNAVSVVALKLMVCID